MLGSGVPPWTLGRRNVARRQRTGFVVVVLQVLIVAPLFVETCKPSYGRDPRLGANCPGMEFRV